MQKNSKEWLLKNGFTGLFYSNECACSIEDFNICGEDCNEDCTPGYKHIDPRIGHKEFGDYVVSGSKEPPTEEEWEGLY